MADDGMARLFAVFAWMRLGAHRNAEGHLEIGSGRLLQVNLAGKQNHN